MREHDAKRQHRAEVRNEASCEDDLAQLCLVEPGLDHNRIDDGDRCRGHGDARDLRLRPGPPDDSMCVDQHAQIGRQEADDADPYARAQVSPDDLSVNLGARQEGEKNGAEAGEEVDPWRDLKADCVARDRSYDDLDERDRYRHPDGND